MINSLLMGWPDGSLPQVVYPETEILSCRCWQHSQVLADQFWSLFIKEYLPNLRTRQKWQSSPPDLRDKAVIMLVEAQLPRSQWPIECLVKVHRCDDGCVRSADDDIKGHIFTWPVVQFVMLPALPSAEEDPPLTSKASKTD